MSRHRPVLPMLLLAAGLALGQPEDVPPLKVTVQGRATGTGFAARDAAIRNAEQNAVVQALEALVADKDLRFLRPIIRRAPDYVSGYSLVGQDSDPRGDTRVTLELALNEYALRRDTAETLLPHLPSPPALLLVAAERFGDPLMPVPDGTCPTATELRTALEKAEVDVLPFSSVAPYYSADGIAEVLWGNLDAGRDFARENEADVVVLAAATLNSKLIAEGADVLEHEARLTLRIYRGADGKLVDALVSTAVINGADAAECAPIAFADAASKAVRDLLVASVLAHIGTPPESGVRLVVENPGTRDRLAQLIAALERDPQVLAVETRFFHPQVARLRVEYRGAMSYLAERLLAAAGAELKRSVGREVVVAFPER